jgi:general secretion pathway protein K
MGGFVSRLTGSEKGMALLMTILIVTLLSLLIIDTNSRSYLAYARARNSVNSLNSYYIMRSGVSAAMGFLERDERESSIDALSEDWAQEIKNFPVGEGTVSVRIVDEASKFNINTLVNAQGTINDRAVERFGRLLRELGIEEGLSSRVAEWLKRNREDLSYRVRDISELLLVPDFVPEAFKKIEGFVTVGTDRRVERNININTVGREVLGALSPELTETLIEAIMDYRKENPFKEIGDLKKVQGVDDPVLSKFSDVLDVKSSVFSVHTEAKVSDVVRRGVAVVKREGGKVKIVAWKEE